MKLPRPYIPLDVRCIVAVRQCAEREINTLQVVNAPLGRRLKHLLILLFAGREHELHHRPALENRAFDRQKQVYIPDANDADYLVYLETHAHYIETHVRGHGALRSDTAHRMHQKRLDQNRGLVPRKPRKEIPSRPFASSAKLMRADSKWWGSRAWPSRKMQSRPWQ